MGNRRQLQGVRGKVYSHGLHKVVQYIVKGTLIGQDSISCILCVCVFNVTTCKEHGAQQNSRHTKARKINLERKQAMS